MASFLFVQWLLLLLAIWYNGYCIASNLADSYFESSMELSEPAN